MEAYSPIGIGPEPESFAGLQPAIRRPPPRALRSRRKVVVFMGFSLHIVGRVAQFPHNGVAAQPSAHGWARRRGRRRDLVAMSPSAREEIGHPSSGGANL